MNKFPLIFVIFAVLVCGACGVDSVAGLRVVRMEGTSMKPAIENDDKLLMSTDFKTINRGDIVHHRFPKDPSKHYLKRIIGLPGETIQLKSGVVFVNGTKIDEPYVDPDYNTVGSTIAPTVIEPDCYYVLGDDRNNSSDSRYWGTVKREFIEAVFIRKL